MTSLFVKLNKQKGIGMSFILSSFSVVLFSWRFLILLCGLDKSNFSFGIQSSSEEEKHSLWIEIEHSYILS